VDTGLLVVLGAISLLVLWVIYAYNRMVMLKNRIAAAWSQIDVQLKRRHDLIPNLVETVKGYATHERELFEAVTKARQAGISAGSVQEREAAENVITQTLKQLFMVAEAYPQLRASENFLQLQEELSGTESKIAYARQFYNDMVMTYHNFIMSFPASIIAGMTGFKERPYFQIEDARERDVVEVHLDRTQQ
jgi:LemA protein